VVAISEAVCPFFCKNQWIEDIDIKTTRLWHTLTTYDGIILFTYIYEWFRLEIILRSYFSNLIWWSLQSTVAYKWKTEKHWRYGWGQSCDSLNKSFNITYLIHEDNFKQLHPVITVNVSVFWYLSYELVFFYIFDSSWAL